MKSNYTLAEQVAYYRNRCAHQAQEIERLKSEKGYEHIKKQCEKEAQEKNKELAAELRQKNSEASRLRKDCDAANLKIGRYEKTIENLENQLCEIKARLQTMMDNHSQDAASIDAMRKEIDRLTKKGDKSEEAFQRELEEARARINELEQTVQDGEKEKDRLTRQVEALGGETQKLHHQIKLDSTTSSIPTLASHFKPPVSNTRDPSENQQGGQPGHPHHARGLQGIPGKAECTICGLDDPLWADPEYCFERYELKHVVKPVMVIMDQYVFVPVFRNLRTGAHKNAACPDWAFDEFNYGPEAKAMMLYMTFIILERVKIWNRFFTRSCIYRGDGVLSSRSFRSRV